ncbi:MAG: right-handed parallel beta-helix repeat-containing protein [Bacteriodetes bacterium]|nr:right-handed parallel beta-helix repeat-containing protein [Bacteroidota bacterium]
MRNISVGLVILVMASLRCVAGYLYADNSLKQNCMTYDYKTRNCSGGTFRAYTTLAQAANVAVAGDTVVLRGGTYSEQLAPQNSGTAKQPIVFLAYATETVTITGSTLAPAIWIFEKSYIHIFGITITNVQRWMAVLGSHHIVISSNKFYNANDAGGSSKTGLFFQNSNDNKILNNIIDNSTQDNIAFVHCNRNLVAGNTVTRAAHTLWTLKCSNYTIIRNNYFHNQYQKIGEIYDCENVGYGDVGYPKITILDSTKFNVVESNVFAYTSTPINASPYAGIQHAGQYCIIRKNVFYNCTGPAVDFTLYADEARNTYGNKLYNNTFYNNRFGGLSVSGVQASGYTFNKNMVANNIFYKNTFTQYDTRWSWYNELNNKPVQIITGRTADILFARNCIYNSAADEPYTIAYGDRTSTSNPPAQNLTWWGEHYPQLFLANLELDPMFVDTAKKNFHLQSQSPLIDAGAFVAVAMNESDGTSNQLVVDNSTYFMDGFSLLGGDTIQFRGQALNAVITNINYQTNTITLHRTMEWKKGDGVSLKFYGKAPDVGATENFVTPNDVTETSNDFFAIYPNPAQTIITLTTNNATTQPLRISITSVTGATLLSTESTESVTTLPIHQLPNGVYTLTVQSATEKRSTLFTVIR